MRRLATLAGLLVLLAGCGAPAVPVPTFDHGPPPETVAAPIRVEIPAIDTGGDLVSLGLNPDGTMAVPPVHTPEVPSWYNRGPRPGELGPAVIAGHVNGDGRPGIFARLDQLEPGELVFVDRADGSRATFEVTRVESYDKDAFDTADVYGDTPGPELRLITCGGSFVGGDQGYDSNVVAYAELVE